MSFANTGGRPVAQDAFTARTDADEAVVAGASCETACPIWNYVAVVAVFPSTQSETPRQWYAAFGGATGQVIEDTTVDRRVAIRVTNGVPYATELVVKDGDRIFLVAYSIRSDMATPAGASKDELDAILALFRFVP